jgi:4-amino-4-deoxy-L-arabinose transferase-like glycosyltransferase
VLVAQVAVGVLLALKIYLAAFMPPIGDEAYYWMWGQKLAWSYFDHPPLHAWLMRLMSLLFGWDLFAIRALTWFTLGGTLWIVWLWARRLKPEDPGAWFWPSAAIYLASPLFWLMSGISFHDHLLIFLCLLTAHLFLVFAEKWEATGVGLRWLYAGAVAMGLAVLTKYNGVLLAFGVAVFFIAHRPVRGLWRSPHLYLAALLAVAIQAPVIWWNITEGFASYKFHLSERWGGTLFHFRPLNILEFLGGAILVISPFLIPAVVGVARRKLGTPFADRARTMALSIFAISSLAMLFLSMFVEVFFYWNIVAVVSLMPLLAGWMRRRWVMVVHILYGVLLAGGFAFDQTIVPLGNMVGRYDWTASSTFGWPAVAERIKAYATQYSTTFVVATRYTTAAQLGFALHDPEVTAIANRHDQYDFWFDPAAHDGQDALVVSDPQLGLAEVAPYFDSLTPLETVPYTALGRTVYEPTIYLGRRFHAK